ncbi:MAG: radical SAM protein [Opitutaceae bacterium]|nr:radical SAM protein [Opitutaceae bacterium]
MPSSAFPTLPSGSTAAAGPKVVTLYCHLDIVDRHLASTALSCLTGWIVSEQGHEVVGLGLRLDEQTVVRCNYPFARSDIRDSVALAGSEALIGFNAVLPERLGFAPARLTFVVLVAADDGEPRPFTFTFDREAGHTCEFLLSDETALPVTPEFTVLPPAEVGSVLESRLFDHLASRRHITLRLDLINKCNLRCVMCHYSNEAFSKRPAQRIAPEQFAAFFDPIAPATRDVVLSCGDEPLMSPHFETIIRELAQRDPEVRIRFCTNGMLLSDKLAAAIIAANVYMVMFSFDGVRPETLHRIRVGSDFCRIIKNVLHLKALRAKSGRPAPRFVFNFVMLESNIHEAPLFVDVAKRLGGSYIDFRHVVPFDFYDIEHEMLEHSKPKYNHYRERIVAAAKAAGIDLYIPPPFATAGRHIPADDPAVNLDEFNELLRSLGEDPLIDPEPAHPVEAALHQPVHESAHFFCDRPFSEVMIREQQDVYPCPWHKEKMGTLDGSTTLEEIFFGEKFRNVRLAMLDPHGAPGCANCPIKENYLPTSLL